MKRGTIIAGAAAAALLPTVARASGAVPVLMYHSVNDGLPRNVITRGLTVPTERFEEQLRVLRAHRIPSLTANELIVNLEHNLPLNGVVFTFDDGYVDAMTNVVPLLLRYGARATFFCNSGSIGTPNHLTWADMRAMQRVGMEIGAHGQHHLDLSTLDREGQLTEAGGCVERIEHYTGVRPVSYAYASGKYNHITFEVMSEIGIRSAWTERVGPVRDLADRYQMPRLRIPREEGIDGFAALIGG